MKRLKKSLFLQISMFAGIIMLALTCIVAVTIWYMEGLNHKSIIHAGEQTLVQMQEKTEAFYDSMNHVAATLVYSPTAYNYFKMERVNRIINRDDITGMYLNMILLEKNIAGMSLYDTDMQEIANMGEKMEIDQAELLIQKEPMEFGNVLQGKFRSVPYYIIYFPVYELENQVYGKQIGMSVWLMKTANFAAILEDMTVTEHTQMFFLDADNQILAEKGSGKYGELRTEMLRNDSSYYVQTADLKMKGWKAVIRIPREEMKGGFGIIYRIILIAYLVAMVSIALFWYFSYKKLLLPMHTVDNFIKNIVKNPHARLRIEREDEIGTVMINLNDMLDEKEALDHKIENSRKRVYEMELSKKQTQIQAYQNQINPHFLYNTFDCIGSMALYHEADDVAEMTMALSKLFRFAVKAENIVMIEEEIQYIKEYAKIIEYRFMGKIRFHFLVDETVKNKRILKMMLQPLVANAVFHGLEKKVEGGQVDIEVSSQEGSKLRFTVRDNGCGMEEEQLLEVTGRLGVKGNKMGIGLSNIYQRLKLFYNDDVSFILESEAGRGTAVTITVPDSVREEK